MSPILNNGHASDWISPIAESVLSNSKIVLVLALRSCWSGKCASPLPSRRLGSAAWRQRQLVASLRATRPRAYLRGSRRDLDCSDRRRLAGTACGCCIGINVNVMAAVKVNRNVRTPPCRPHRSKTCCARPPLHRDVDAQLLRAVLGVLAGAHSSVAQHGFYD